jgi:predicted DNA-binding protein (UPF0251 family)
MMSPEDLRISFKMLGLDQAEAALLFDVSPRTVSRWIEGEAVPGTVEQAVRAWRRLNERGLAWRPDSVSVLNEDQQQIAAQREHAVALDEVLKRVEARHGPRFPWKVDLERCRATFGKMELSFYKLASGSFSPAHYRRQDILPDVQRDRELIDDAIFCIAKAMRKEAAIPVTLVYMDGPNFPGPDGTFGSMRNEEFSSNDDAIERACELTKLPNVHSIFIREGKRDTSGEFLWDDSALRAECERRSWKKAVAAGKKKLATAILAKK